MRGTSWTIFQRLSGWYIMPRINNNVFTPPPSATSLVPDFHFPPSLFPWFPTPFSCLCPPGWRFLCPEYERREKGDCGRRTGRRTRGVDRGGGGGCETEICTNLRLLVMSGDKLLRWEEGEDWQERGRRRWGRWVWWREKEEQGVEDGNKRRKRWKKCGRWIGGWVPL